MFRPVRQRLVRTHPVTGRKSLFLSAHAGGIVGWPVPEARAFLRDLVEHATQPRFVYSHKWRQWDLVMWDNRQTMHRVHAVRRDAGARHAADHGRRGCDDGGAGGQNSRRRSRAPIDDADNLDHVRPSRRRCPDGSRKADWPLNHGAHAWSDVRPWCRRCVEILPVDRSFAAMARTIRVATLPLFGCDCQPDVLQVALRPSRYDDMRHSGCGTGPSGTGRREKCARRRNDSRSTVCAAFVPQLTEAPNVRVIQRVPDLPVADGFADGWRLVRCASTATIEAARCSAVCSTVPFGSSASLFYPWHIRI